MARFPTDDARIASAYGVQRPTHVHQGVDIVGTPGQDVKAPEAMVVERIVIPFEPDRADNTHIAPPWNGYGPGLVFARGAAGYHLLAHLGRVDVQVGDHLEEGETIGALASHVGASRSHVHWEIRTQQRHGFTIDPVEWVSNRSTEKTPVVRKGKDHKEAGISSGKIIGTIIIGGVIGYFIKKIFFKGPAE